MINRIFDKLLNHNINRIFLKSNRIFFYLMWIVLSVNLSPLQAKTEAIATFDSIYYYIGTEVSGTNMELAIEMTDSLIENSTDLFEKMRSLMLLATLEQRRGDMVKAIHIANNAESLALELKSKEWTMRILGFLYSAYEGVGLVEKSTIVLKELEKVNKKEKNPLIQLYIHQEKMIHYLYNEDFNAVLEELSLSETYLNILKETDASSLHFGTNYQLKGIVYYHLDELDSAKYYLNNALEALPESSFVLLGYINAYLSKVYLAEKDIENFKKYIEITESYLDGSDDFKLQIAYHEALKDYGILIKDSSIEHQHQLIINELKLNRSETVNAIANELIKDININNEKLKKKNNIIIAISILLIALVLIFYTLKSRKEKLKYRAIVQAVKKEIKEKELELFKAQKERALSQEEITIEAKQLKNTKEHSLEPRENSLNIPVETIDAVMKKLSSFEKTNAFLKNNISLAKLAARVDVNTKYLSYILNQYKEQDFNTYINNLRIKYILEKLIENEEYLEYKIAYLAEECGFSTHSRFSAAFKQITGTTPSSFIDNRKKEVKIKKNK